MADMVVSNSWTKVVRSCVRLSHGDASKGATVLLYYSPNRHIPEDLTRNADRVFYFEEGPRANADLIRWAEKASM